jgi:hypothetical protein
LLALVNANEFFEYIAIPFSQIARHGTKLVITRTTNYGECFLATDSDLRKSVFLPTHAPVYLRRHDMRKYTVQKFKHFHVACTVQILVQYYHTHVTAYLTSIHVQVYLSSMQLRV